MIVYASRQLEIYEKNYATHGLKLGAMIFTLEMWKHILVARLNIRDHRVASSTREALYGRKCRSLVLSAEIGKGGKLSLRYVGPFEILERIGPVAYLLRLPEELADVHDTFRVSNLKKCLAKDSLHVSLDEIKIEKTLCFIKEPVEIMDCDVTSLKRSRIPIVKVRWNSKRGLEFTWEREEYMKSKYPQLFVDRIDDQTS
ncbi:hypothetical protein Tco_0865248 [Tanacetum coccineum]